MKDNKLLVLNLTQNIPFVLFTDSTTPTVPEEIYAIYMVYHQ